MLYGHRDGAAIESRLALRTYGVERLEPRRDGDERQRRALAAGARVVRLPLARSPLKQVAEEALAALGARCSGGITQGQLAVRLGDLQAELEAMPAAGANAQTLAALRQALDGAARAAGMEAREAAAEALKEFAEAQIAVEEYVEGMFCPMVKKGERIAVRSHEPTGALSGYVLPNDSDRTHSIDQHTQHTAYWVVLDIMPVVRYSESGFVSRACRGVIEWDGSSITWRGSCC